MPIDVVAQLNAIGTYPLYDSRQGLGGLMQVADAAARAAITTARRRHGMLVFQQDTQVTYRLAADLTTWAVAVSEMTENKTTNLTTDILQATLDASPTAVRHFKHTINLGVGNYTGPRIDGFTGGDIEIKGTWVIPTLTTGVNTGTCGAGSGATIVNKPTGSPDWTPGNLVGRWFKPLSGAAYFGEDFEAAYLIVSNTATQAVLVESAYGVDATTTFNIVEPGTVFNIADPDNFLPAQQNPLTYLCGVFACTSKIAFARIKFVGSVANYGFLTIGTQSVDVVRCSFDGAFVLPGYSSDVRFVECYFHSGSYYYAFGQNVTTFLSNLMLASSAAFEIFQYVNIRCVIDGDVGYASALTVKDGITASVGGEYKNCTSGTPVVLTNIHNFRVASSIIGANPGTSYGLQVSGGGQYNWAGAAVAGSLGTQILFETRALTYASVSANGTYEMNGSFGKWGTGATVRLDSVTVYEGQQYHYGFVRNLTPAYKEITAAASGLQADATVIAYVITMVKTAGNNHSIRFFGAAEILVTGGLHGEIRNLSGNNVRLYPPTGFKIFYQNGDMGLNNYLNMPADATFFWATDNDGNYHVS